MLDKYQHQFNKTYWLLIVLLVLGAFMGLRYFGLPQGRIVQGVKIGPVSVGNMTKEQAAANLRNYARKVEEKPIELGWSKLKFTLRPKDLGFRLKVSPMVEKAYGWGREEKLATRMLHRCQAKAKGITIPLQYTYDYTIMEQWLQKVGEKIAKKPQDAMVRPGPKGKILIDPGIKGLKLIIPDTKRIIDKLLIKEGIRKGNLSVAVVEPKLTKARLASLGVKELISWYNTRFDAGNVNRAHNIKLAANVFNNMLWLPGERFSFVQTLEGAVYNPDLGGFKEAPVIIDNEFVTGVGGGVCQVSTTLYNAALLANLKIVERNHHSLPVSYVPLGFDAAVAGNYLDLKIQNSRKQAVLVVAKMERDSLTFMLFGTKKAGEQVYTQYSDKQVIPPGMVRKREPSWPVGVEVREEGKPGYKVITWRIIKSAEGEKRELLTKDFYKPVPVKIILGTRNN